jgi:hypothetical protein
MFGNNEKSTIAQVHFSAKEGGGGGKGVNIIFLKIHYSAMDNSRRGIHFIWVSSKTGLAVRFTKFKTIGYNWSIFGVGNREIL